MEWNYSIQIATGQFYILCDSTIFSYDSFRIDAQQKIIIFLFIFPFVNEKSFGNILSEKNINTFLTDRHFFFETIVFLSSTQ